MRTRCQLLIWTSIILALSLVLFNRLHDTSAVADDLANTVQLDVTRIDLASMLSDSNLIESREKSSKESAGLSLSKSVAESQLTETTTEALGYEGE